MKKETVDTFVKILVSLHTNLVSNCDYDSSIDGSKEKKAFDALVSEGYEEVANDIKEFFELYDENDESERFYELSNKYNLGFN